MQYFVESSDLAGGKIRVLLAYTELPTARLCPSPFCHIIRRCIAYVVGTSSDFEPSTTYRIYFDKRHTVVL